MKRKRRRGWKPSQPKKEEQLEATARVSFLWGCDLAYTHFLIKIAAQHLSDLTDKSPKEWFAILSTQAADAVNDRDFQEQLSWSNQGYDRLTETFYNRHQQFPPLR